MQMLGRRAIGWIVSPSNHGFRIVREAVYHSALLLILDFGVKLFDAVLELIDSIFPHSRNISYLPFDTLRLMITIADTVVVVLFGLLAVRTVYRFAQLVLGRPK